MTLAMIAGAGELPALIAARQPEPPLIASLTGHMPEGLAPEIVFRLEHLGGTLAALKARGVTQLCLVGKVTRPVVDMAALDEATRPLLPRLIEAMTQGDDAALRAFIAVFEEAGFEVVGAHEIAEDLLPEAGILAGAVSEGHRRDAARGLQVIEALGAADVGQACVVAGGQALAVEALPGTDWMLRSLMAPAAPTPDLTDPLGMAADWLSGPVPELKRDASLPVGGVLVKAPKPGQELRVDLPTIGPDTVALAAQTGLEGIVVAAGGVLVLEPDRCRALASEHGLFLWVRDGAEP